MQLNDAFDTVADLYDAVRPAYPPALFQTLGEAAALEPGDWALEVGCGSGQAKAGLLDLGLTVTAVDPGPALIGAAKRRFAGCRKVDFVVASFEVWTPPARAFRLVASAQAWHWIDPAIGFTNAARALEPGGLLAVFGHVPAPLPEQTLARLEPIFARHAPELWTTPEAWYLPDGPVPNLFAASRHFAPARHRAFPWIWRKTVDQHLDFLRSRSDYQRLAEGRREALLTAIAPVLARDGPDLALPYETHLHWAPRLDRCAAPPDGLYPASVS